MHKFIESPASTQTRSQPPAALSPLEAQLLAEGYRPGAPSHIHAETQAIDRAICRRQRCPACRKGLDYRPFQRGRSYRVLAACRHCDHAVEQ